MKKYRPAWCHPERRYFARGMCNKCWQHAYYVKNRTIRLLQSRQHEALKDYGLTFAQCQLLRQQACEICGTRKPKMCIDHKLPGTYRGILCNGCNIQLGWFERHQLSIQAYLEKG